MQEDFEIVHQSEPKLPITDGMTLEQMACVLDSDHLYSGEEIQDVLRLLPKKVDGCVQYCHRLQDEAERARDYAKKFSELAKQIESRSEKFEVYVQAALASNGFEKMTGDAFTIELKNNPSSVKTTREPSAVDSFNFPNLVTSNVKFSWNKKAIKEHIEAGLEVDFASLERKKSLKMGIKK